MSVRPGEAGQQVFRPNRVLAVLMALADLLWFGVLVYLLTFEGVPAKTLLSALFFVAFFGVALAYYARTAIFVDARGLTYRGVLGTVRLAYGEIRKIEVLPGPVTVYAVRGPNRLLHFTSFFQNHRGLASLVVERAGLAPLRG